MNTINTLFAHARETLRRREVRRELNRLDERSLWDIGMNRADVDMRFG